MSTMKTTRPGKGPRAVIVGLFALLMAVAPLSDAFARAGSRSGGSFGNRGAMTNTMPRTTPTAPNQASPLAPSPGVGQQAPRPGMATPAAAQPKRGLFGGGFMGGLLGGLFAAGLFGMLFGGGFGAGLGGFASILGLLLQVGLIVGLVWLAMRFFRGRQQNGPATAGAGPLGNMGQARTMGGGMGGSPFGFGGGAAPKPQPITLDAQDFDQFESTLKAVQDAYSREDIATLRRLCTAEVAGVFEQEIAQNTEAGVRNLVSDVTLLQGDLSEAWREGSIDYATVAMRFGFTDRTVNRVTGQMVDGSDQPQQAVELWTFRRAAGTRWALSAVQQAG
ncbi:TIM44-like domain-containing protein [Segnochrobactraceae bacterium EtOH-i3]